MTSVSTSWSVRCLSLSVFSFQSQKTQPVCYDEAQNQHDFIDVLEEFVSALAILATAKSDNNQPIHENACMRRDSHKKYRQKTTRTCRVKTHLGA